MTCEASAGADEQLLSVPMYPASAPNLLTPVAWLIFDTEMRRQSH